MSLRFFIAFVLFVAAIPLSLAQQGADARRVIPAASTAAGGSIFASFSLGLTRDNGITYRTDARAADAVDIVASIRPESQQIGKLADIFLLVAQDGAFVMLSSTGALIPWSGDVQNLVPMMSNITLEESFEFTVFSGVVGAVGEFPIYLAYREVGSSDITYTSNPSLILLTNELAPTQSQVCSAYGNRSVNIGYTSPLGVFTRPPFHADDLSIITNGEDTNDARFSYQWIKNQGELIDIFAPADGVLVRIRHKAENLPDFASDDFDLFFLIACDPDQPAMRDTVVRFNHITNPRPDIKAAYAFGELGAPTFNPFDEHEDRQVPLTNIAVKAGDYIGSTSGTPFARNFDFLIGIDQIPVCPFSVLEEPHRTMLMNLLGPLEATPFGPPVAGFSCSGYGGSP